MTACHINAIATATPDHDIHAAFVAWAGARIGEDRHRALFSRMAARSGIVARWSVLPRGPGGGSPVGAGGFYAEPVLPGTAARMQAYARHAPDLAMQAVAGLGDAFRAEAVTHLVVASCTGFVAPGLDQIIAGRLGLAASVERLMIGFMGCYAAVTALRQARHIVRSAPDAVVLVVTVELSTLHLQDTGELEPLLAMLQFGDGAAAAIVSAKPRGMKLGEGFALALPESGDLITWTVGDQGFAMQLSGEVPGRIAAALGAPEVRRAIVPGGAIGDIDGWAVHAGGRSILDAVEGALDLPGHALAASRAVLADSGNMSSATLMFVLARMMTGPPIANGIAIAFGPGLAAEGFGFASVA